MEKAVYLDSKVTPDQAAEALAYIKQQEGCDPMYYSKELAFSYEAVEMFIDQIKQERMDIRNGVILTDTDILSLQAVARSCITNRKCLNDTYVQNIYDQKDSNTIEYYDAIMNVYNLLDKIKNVKKEGATVGFPFSYGQRVFELDEVKGKWYVFESHIISLGVNEDGRYFETDCGRYTLDLEDYIDYRKYVFSDISKAHEARNALRAKEQKEGDI